MLKDIPELRGDNALEALLNFYKDLGWNRMGQLDPTKVKMNKEDWSKLFDKLVKLCPEDRVSVGFLVIDKGPSGDNNVPKGKVLWEVEQ
ncbi:MAG: hypothetical protein H8D26_04735 [Methanomicrobia archaeon]|nr:hypothetical protein [Methanomicrobia archaeon]